ncbi:hypothetical protein TWF481_008099 [Arthrobotrys musiformis]|uniref:Nucleoside phosphorylase domain-containing protein n=1 Tax=Arthrobotrys musiformis TaxID=47236 RepID=A0AAV9W8A4_9PEZI
MTDVGIKEKRLGHDSYTVGWVCVLLCELNASRAMLDEEHEQLDPVENDNNSYILGQIQKHNVVIAFPGSASGGAAQTVTNLIRTYRNIRFGLMVGVGGGAPNPLYAEDPDRDIRLGDVVISDPKGKHGGVLLYDAGNWDSVTDGFEIESHLNKPPNILLKAVQLLRSNHDFGGVGMRQSIQSVAEKSTKFRALKSYRFPGRNQDRLFKPDHRHVGKAGGDCSACDVNLIEKRLERDSDDPIVHYGLIASGNAVMRFTQLRDKLRNAWNVSCFERAAAGIMDDFPCLVIRGISDYADDHQNEIWQPYAAVAAAAYAKDLLRVIQPREVETLRPANEVVGSSEGRVGHIPISQVTRARERDKYAFRLELENLVVKLLSLPHRHGWWYNEEFRNLVERFSKKWDLDIGWQEASKRHNVDRLVDSDDSLTLLKSSCVSLWNHQSQDDMLRLEWMETLVSMLEFVRSIGE